MIVQKHVGFMLQDIGRSRLALIALHGKRDDRHGAKVHIWHDGKSITGGGGVADNSRHN